MGALQILVHLILTCHYSYGIYIYLFGLSFPPEIKALRTSFGGPFKYLTFIDMLLQCSYFGLALINDFLGSNSTEERKVSKFQKARDYYFSTVIFPIGAVVSISFWILWFINRELIFPKIFDSFFPTWLNHNIHTTPLFGVLIEMFICPHFYPTGKKGFITITSAVILYIMWIWLIAIKTGFWVYPILQKLPVVGRIAFFIGVAFLAYIIYAIGEYLNQKVWGLSSKKMKKIS